MEYNGGSIAESERDLSFRNHDIFYLSVYVTTDAVRFLPSICCQIISADSAASLTQMTSDYNIQSKSAAQSAAGNLPMCCISTRFSGSRIVTRIRFFLTAYFAR